MHALVAHHYLDGGNYPRGTSRKIAETISDFIEKNGGKLAINAGVKKIKTHKNKAVAVIMENGDVIEGLWNNGLINGKGIEKKIDGQKYEGNFVEGNK